MADDDMVMIRGSSNGAAVSVLLRGANDYMLDEMDRSLHDAFCVVKRVLESGKVVPGAQAPHILAMQSVPPATGLPLHTLIIPALWPMLHTQTLLASTSGHGTASHKAFAGSDQRCTMGPAPRR